MNSDNAKKTADRLAKLKALLDSGKSYAELAAILNVLAEEERLQNQASNEKQK